jgi:hypothetical protein
MVHNDAVLRSFSGRRGLFCEVFFLCRRLHLKLGKVNDEAGWS